MGQFLFGLFVGLVTGILVTRYWEDVVEKVAEVRDTIMGQDPEDVQRRVNNVSVFFRKYALLIVFVVLVLCIVGTVLVINAQPRTVQLGGFIRLVDSCGVEHNVQIEAAHVSQGFVLVAPGTTCELKQPLGVH